MATGIYAKRSKIEIKIGTTWTKINGLKSFSGLGGGSPSIIDASTLDSDAKEKMRGLVDEGQVSLTFNYLPTDPGQIGLMAAREDLDTEEDGFETDFRITISNKKVHAFKALVLTAELGADMDSLVPLSSTLELTGKITTSEPV